MGSNVVFTDLCVVVRAVDVAVGVALADVDVDVVEVLAPSRPLCQFNFSLEDCTLVAIRDVDALADQLCRHFILTQHFVGQLFLEADCCLEELNLDGALGLLF